MDNKRNPFKRPTAEEQARIDARNKEKEKLQKEVEELASKCLNDSKFIKYREKHLKLENLVIGYLKVYEEPDVVKYATTVKVAFAKLNQLGLLLHDIRLDNRTRKEKR